MRALAGSRWKWILVIGTAVLLLALCLVQYVRYLSLRNALIELVAEETEGAYVLDLKEVDADWRRLIFTFQNARLAPTRPVDAKSAFYVDLPMLRIDLGRLRFGKGAQIEIEEFTLQEPVIRMARNRPADRTSGNSSELPLAISHVFTGLGALLDNFTIDSFQIIRGDFSIARSDSTLIAIRLIDLVISNWNTRQIGPQSRLSVGLGSQFFNVPGGSVTFESLKYEFQQRTASLLDLKYVKTDSLTGSTIEINAKELKVHKVEYQELRESRYHLRKVEIVDPRIRGRLVASGQSKQKDERLLGRIIREAVGQVTVDTLVIANANGHLVFTGSRDSTLIAYEHINLRVGGFHVDQETDSVHIAAVRISGGRSRLVAGNQYEVSFDSIAFNLMNRRNFAIFNFTLNDPQTGQRLLYAREGRLTRFRLLRLVFFNELLADEVRFRDVRAHVPQRVIFAGTGRSAGKPPMQIDLARIVIENADVSVDRGAHRVTVQDLWLGIRNLRKSGPETPSFHLDRLSLRSVEYESRNQLKVSGSNILVLNDSLAAGALRIDKDTSVRLSLSDLRVACKVPFTKLTEPGELSFRSVFASHADVRVRSSTPGDSSSARRPVSIDRLALGIVNLDVSAQQFTLKAEGRDWVAGPVTLGESPGVEEVAGRLRNLRLSTKDMRVSVPEFRLSTRLGSEARDVDLALNDGSLHAHLEQVGIGSIQDLMGQRKISRLSAAAVRGSVSKPSFRGAVTLDSLTVRDILAGAEPGAGEVILYSPSVEGEMFKTSGSTDRKVRFSNVSTPKGIGSVQIVNGGLRLQSPTGTVSAIGLHLATNLRSDLRLLVSRLEKPGENMMMVLDSFRLHNSDMQVGSLSFLPLKTEQEYMKSEFETSHLAVVARDIQLVGFRPDSLFLGRQIVGNALNLGSLDVTSFRDQRLPDPPPQTKPFLDALIRKVPVPLNIPFLKIDSGSIRASQISEKHGERGQISFEKLNVEARNISNLPGADPLSISGSALVYGKAPVKYYYKVKDEHHFTFNTEISDLDLTLLNQQTIPMARLEILSGYLNSLQVTSEADTARSTGTATITYDDLHIRFINEDRSVLKGLGTELLSLIADRLVVRKDKSEAVATFEQDRLKHKAIFNYWARTGMKGASASILKGRKRRGSQAGR